MNDKINSAVSACFSGVKPAATPTLTFVLGPIAAGKTRFRRARYTGVAVQLDAGDIFNALGGADSPDFPGALEASMNDAGRRIAERAIAERYSLVLEVAGDEREVFEEIAERMRALGYEIRIEALTVDIEVALQRNETRGPDNIPSIYAQQYHLKWLRDATASGANSGDF